MRVLSPIGDLPFTITGVRRSGAGIVVEGELGAWRSQVEMGPEDMPDLARALRTPLLVATGAVAALWLMRRL